MSVDADVYCVGMYDTDIDIDMIQLYIQRYIQGTDVDVMCTV